MVVAAVVLHLESFVRWDLCDPDDKATSSIPIWPLPTVTIGSVLSGLYKHSHTQDISYGEVH